MHINDAHPISSEHVAGSFWWWETMGLKPKQIVLVEQCCHFCDTTSPIMHWTCWHLILAIPRVETFVYLCCCCCCYGCCCCSKLRAPRSSELSLHNTTWALAFSCWYPNRSCWKASKNGTWIDCSLAWSCILDLQKWCMSDATKTEGWAACFSKPELKECSVLSRS